MGTALVVCRFTRVMGRPHFVELRRDGVRIRFDPILANKLQTEEEIEILYHFTDAEFDDLRRVFDYFNGTEA